MKKTDKRLENLKPFKPGDDDRRNLKGAPKKLPELDKLLAEVLGEEKDGIEAAQAILMALRARATKGDVKAAELLLNRAYGKPKEKIDITNNSAVDLSGLSDEELLAFAMLQQKMRKKD